MLYTTYHYTETLLSAALLKPLVKVEYYVTVCCYLIVTYHFTHTDSVRNSLKENVENARGEMDTLRGNTSPSGYRPVLASVYFSGKKFDEQCSKII